MSLQPERDLGTVALVLISYQECSLCKLRTSSFYNVTTGEFSCFRNNGYIIVLQNCVFFSWHSWLDVLFCTGVKRDLQEDDLSLCPEELESERLYNKFNKYVCGNHKLYNCLYKIRVFKQQPRLPFPFSPKERDWLAIVFRVVPLL